jgi:hypothetical protein
MNCAYCRQQAMVEIPAVPSWVCLTHALEFWSGLLTYAKDQATLTREQFVEIPCVCGLCTDIAAPAAAQRLVATPFGETWRDLPMQ